MSNFTLKWHPQFRIEDADENQVLFLGERKQYILPKEEYQSIDSVVQQKGRLSDFVFNTANLLVGISALERIDSLREDGILESEESDMAFGIPDFDESSQEIMIGQVPIILLSTLIEEVTVREYFSELALPQETVLVLVDDYLDQRLLKLGEELRATETSWIICQLSGDVPMIGPLFNTSDKSTSYSQLRKRLLQNQPVREWLRRRKGEKSPMALPLVKDAYLQKQAVDCFMVNYLDKESLRLHADQLLTYDHQKKEGVLHHIAYEVGETSFDKPIDLNSVSKHNDDDGGYRHTSRKETLSRLLPLVSPVTGFLAELKEITEWGTEEELAIFQAAYFQNSFSKVLVTADTFVQLSLGKGVSREQAMTSALGEALERHAAQYQGTEPSIFCKPVDLEHPAMLPQELNPFSTEQYQVFETFDSSSLQQPQWVKEYHKDIPIHWIKGWSLTKENFVYIPFAHCFANTPHEDQCYSQYTHNGNAAGNTKEEAILQGLFELIERDATAVWWYNQVPRPAINLEIIPVDKRVIIDKTLSKEWDYWLLDITNDISVLTCVAIGKHKTSGKFVMGFGTHLDASIACQRALTEMYQLIIIKDKVTGPFDFDDVAPHPFLLPARKQAVREAKNFVGKDNMGIKASLLYLIEALKAVDLEVLVVDYTRPEIPLSTLKVIVPGLCHLWPQLANQRLYNVPVKMKWLPLLLKTEELNPMELYL